MVSAFSGVLSSSAAPAASGRASDPGGVPGCRHWVHSGRGAEPSCGEAPGFGLGFQPRGVFPAVRDPRKGWVPWAWMVVVGTEQGGEGNGMVRIFVAVLWDGIS